MATASTVVRHPHRNHSNSRHTRYSGHHSSSQGSLPDLTRSFSSSADSSKSNGHEPRKRSNEREQHHQQNHRSSRGRTGRAEEIYHNPVYHTPDEDRKIMRGAEFVRTQLHADSSRRERENIHRGAEIIREQLMAQSADDATSETSHISPRGVASPFGMDANSTGTTIKHRNSRYDRHDLHAASQDVLDDVENLSQQMSSTGFDAKGTQPADSKQSSDSSMGSSSKHRFYFDPFADEDEEDEAMPPPPPPEREATPPTFMGRDNSIRVKIENIGDSPDYERGHQYPEKFDQISTPRSHDVATYHDELHYFKQQSRGEYTNYSESMTREREQMMSRSAGTMLEKKVPPPVQADFRYEDRGSRPSSSRARSGKDRAYQHAMNAGLLWQTLVGEHVRFPKEWWGGARTPTMGNVDDATRRSRSRHSPSEWSYISRHRVRGNELLNSWVRNRSSAGTLLLHIIVSDALTQEPMQDVAIGCFHPNARGVRRTLKPVPDDEDVREIWMAVRKRVKVTRRDLQRGSGHDGLTLSLINTALTLGHSIEEVGKPSPLGGKHSVTNDNVRAVFGDKPPIETVFIPSRELYKIIIDAVEEERERGLSSPCPSRTLLQEFLFTRKR